MNPAPASPASSSEFRKRGSKALLWLFVFLYLPFVIAHGFMCWPEPAVDFPPLYSATKAVFDQHQSPYGENAFAQQSAALGRPVPPFIYPPPSLLFFFPLHLFDYDTAKALLLVANHVCLLFATGFIFGRLFREEFAQAHSQLTAALVLIYILLFDPAVVTLHLGQVNLFLLVCICLTWNALKTKRHDLAIAIPLTLAIVIKTYPVLLLPLLIARRRYRAAGWTVALFALVCAASYFLLPADMWPDWIGKVLPAGSEAHAGPWNQNIRAFVARTFLPNPFSEPVITMPSIAQPMIGMLTLAVLGTTLWVSFKTWRLPPSPRSVDLQMSLYLFMIFLIAPVSWEHHFVYLLPSLVLLLLLLTAGRVHGQWRWIIALSLCLIAWRIPITLPELKTGFRTFAISAKFYPMVVLWIFFAMATLRLGRERADYNPTA